ncbi:MAG TPA: phosphoribosyl-AMP cyclohydrolase [Cellvibrionaceae bacterium]|nr:phosphoribosyl-AMP cyclohydrolase [Cellvibrionaceae bacterium]HMW71474.1 phosphoribosyl-AMP cyclohydrolase [Cellvibrionaceae bacterium]HMY40954.1 phosphoribosyl-AMP cyclohydrolase [Marinagarivorans sp.]HNG60220.1 phosphoribosyl-AMP cyclohydrolase [Cellvibrionaceae bacterium]
MPDYLSEIRWTADGLVPVIAQDVQSGKVLMMAWMNRDALQATVETNRAVYWSRSRKALWHKGETSGHEQIVHSIDLDCDADVLILSVEQQGGIACHTGRQSCFYRRLVDGQWQIQDPVLKDPNEIYQ